MSFVLQFFSNIVVGETKFICMTGAYKYEEHLINNGTTVKITSVAVGILRKKHVYPVFKSYIKKEL